MCAVGVREDESAKRRGRDVFGARVRRKSEREYRSLSHTYAMFQIDKQGRGGYECQFISFCKENKDTIANPIYHFTTKDIWEYVERFGVKMNPLYEKGFHRVGCIGCPLSTNQKKEFELYPKYKENYIKAFDRMLKKREEDGKAFTKYKFKDGLDVFRWWVGEDPKQIRIEELIEKENDT